MTGKLNAGLASHHFDHDGTCETRIAELLAEAGKQTPNTRAGYVETRAQSRRGPPQAAGEPEPHRLGLKAADNRKLMPATALRMYDLPGRKEEQFPESLEVGYVATIRETAARGSRSRQHRKLQTMFTRHADDIDGPIPDTADDLRVPEPERRFRLYFFRDPQQSASRAG
jgi:hypothetical protein